MTKFLLRRFVPNYQDTSKPEVRAAYAYLEAWVSIIGNTVLATINFSLGVLLNSIALMANATHTAADVLTSLVVLFGFREANRPADKEHPYGHGRVETIATLIIAILLIIVGVEFAKSSIDRLISRVSIQGSVTAAGVLFVVGVLKELMARFSIDLGKAISASALEADAWHHRSDGIANWMVGVSLILGRFGYGWLDAVFGLGVSALIVYTGFKLAKSSSSTLIGEKPDDELVASVKELVLSVPNVKSTHKFSLHDYGGKRILTLHIQVPDNLHVDESHSIAGWVKGLLKEKLGIETVVHVEPSGERIDRGKASGQTEQEG
ncbi:MAG TPA: cation transporter [Firmicutes bacterium]|nr:cation transporter [Bacillota bacterium]